MKIFRLFLLLLLTVSAYAQAPIRRQFFTTNDNPIVDVVAGSNATVQASTPAVNIRRFTINAVPTVGQTNNTIVAALTNIVIVTNVSGTTTLYSIGGLTDTNIVTAIARAQTNGLATTNFVLGSQVWTNDAGAITPVGSTYITVPSSSVDSSEIWLTSGTFGVTDYGSIDFIASAGSGYADFRGREGVNQIDFSITADLSPPNGMVLNLDATYGGNVFGVRTNGDIRTLGTYYGNGAGLTNLPSIGTGSSNITDSGYVAVARNLNVSTNLLVFGNQTNSGTISAGAVVTGTVTATNATLRSADSQRIFELPLDVMPGALAAYSTFQLSTNYSGNILTLRRNHDNATNIFGLNAYRVVDTNAIALWGDASSDFWGSNYVTTWFDQSGNGHNAYQATEAKQPDYKFNVFNLPLVSVNPFKGKSYLNLPNTLTFNSTNVSIYMVLRHVTSDIYLPLTFIGTDNTDFIWLQRITDNYSVWDWYGAGSGKTSTNSIRAANTSFGVVGLVSRSSNAMLLQETGLRSYLSASASVTITGPHLFAGFNEAFYSGMEVVAVLIYPAHTESQANIVVNSLYLMYGDNPKTTQMFYDGDSICSGYQVSRSDSLIEKAWPFLSLSKSRRDLIGYNAAKASLRVTGPNGSDWSMLNRATNNIDPLLKTNLYQRSIVIMSGGVNDINNGTNAATLLAGVSNYCKARTLLGAKTIVTDLIPYQGMANNDQRLLYNAQIATQYVNFADGFIQVSTNDWTPGGSYATYYQDGVHPNDAGNQLFVRSATNVIASLLPVYNPPTVLYDDSGWTAGVLFSSTALTEPPSSGTLLTNSTFLWSSNTALNLSYSLNGSDVITKRIATDSDIPVGTGSSNITDSAYYAVARNLSVNTNAEINNLVVTNLTVDSGSGIGVIELENSGTNIISLNGTNGTITSVTNVAQYFLGDGSGLTNLSVVGLSNITDSGYVAVARNLTVSTNTILVGSNYLAGVTTLSTATATNFTVSGTGTNVLGLTHFTSNVTASGYVNATNFYLTTPQWIDVPMNYAFSSIGPSAPALTAVTNNSAIQELAFDNGDILYAQAQFPHNIATTNSTFPVQWVEPHIHFSTVGTLDSTHSNVTWRIEWELASIGQLYKQGTNSVTVGVAANFTHYLAELGHITNTPPAGISAVFRCRLMRPASVAQDYSNAHDVLLDGFDVHVPVGNVTALGSRDETSQ